MRTPLATVPALSEIGGLVHGFGRRAPAPETREATARRVAEALAPRGDLLLLRQVHGSQVASAPWAGRPEADAGVSSTSGIVLGIETADCLPVLLVDPERRLAAAAHAGWRGTVAGVVARAVEALVARGARAAALLAALGPGIGPCCYEVGDEVRAAFGPNGAPFFMPGLRGRDHLDVRGANLAQLVAAGLDPLRIHQVDECTACLKERYHSYRRDGPGAGRMISFVGWAR